MRVCVFVCGGGGGGKKSLEGLKNSHKENDNVNVNNDPPIILIDVVNLAHYRLPVLNKSVHKVIQTR